MPTECGDEATLTLLCKAVALIGRGKAKYGECPLRAVGLHIPFIGRIC